VQVATENLLMDAERGILAVLVVSAYDAFVRLFDVPRHAAAEAGIRQIARQFWDNVATGHRPAPDFTRDAETIAGMFPRQEPGKAIDLSGDNRLLEILPRREDLKDAIDGFRKELDGIDAEVKFKLGDAETAELPGWRLTWKEEFRKAYTVEASSRRVLRVKEMKDKEQAA
jgi:predicted phage-related endonuclease